ncbi:MAG: hypothetical protein KAH13_03290, partial [Tenericutes bacterium]|nr:hypothetical protein [Mycoplasmatota bacterium]
MVNKFALANPNISFRLTNNQKLTFVSSGNNQIIDIIASIYSKEVAKKMISFEGENRDYKITGFTTNPIINRSSRNYINIFINQRHITDTRVASVLKECYEQLIPKNRYPIVVLYIECDPSIIDVNIHPRKQEIKFSEYSKLLDLIKKTISVKVGFQSIYQEVKPTDFQQEKIVFSESPKTDYMQSSLEIETLQDNETIPEPRLVIPDIEYIGQYSGTYLIFQNEKGLYLLDQHAAAERIRYERYIKKMSAENGNLQDLLVAITLNLSNEIIIQLQDYLDG